MHKKGQPLEAALLIAVPVFLPVLKYVQIMDRAAPDHPYIDS